MTMLNTHIDPNNLFCTYENIKVLPAAALTPWDTKIRFSYLSYETKNISQTNFLVLLFNNNG